MDSAIAAGILLGLSSGLAPGPLMTLVIAQSMQHGSREGCKIALAPLVTDAPIILLTLTAATRASQLQPVMGWLSVAGGLFVFYLAVTTARAQPPEVSTTAAAHPRSWLKGALTNALSPHPWLFWMTVGAATFARAMRVSSLAAALFLITFYVFLVGAKITLALLVGRSHSVLPRRVYRLILVGLGGLLAAFAVMLIWDGMQRLQ